MSANHGTYLPGAGYTVDRPLPCGCSATQKCALAAKLRLDIDSLPLGHRYRQAEDEWHRHIRSQLDRGHRVDVDPYGTAYCPCGATEDDPGGCPAMAAALEVSR